jgi:hypothetical protein
MTPAAPPTAAMMPVMMMPVMMPVTGSCHACSRRGCRDQRCDYQFFAFHLAFFLSSPYRAYL